MSRDLVPGAEHPADTRNTLAARAACPWLSVDESMRLPGWLLELLHEANAWKIRGTLLQVNDRYWISVLEKRLADLEPAAEAAPGACDLDDDGCPGHPAGPFDPMGATVYCDGSCQARPHA